MARFCEEFKYSIVKKMMPPKNESVNTIARETGLTEATLYNWKKNAKSKGMAVPGGENFFVPLPTVTDVQAFNEELLERSEADWDREQVPCF